MARAQERGERRQFPDRHALIQPSFLPTLRQVHGSYEFPFLVTGRNTNKSFHLTLNLEPLSLFTARTSRLSPSHREIGGRSVALRLPAWRAGLFWRFHRGLPGWRWA
jgi:hypothetical protein